MSVSNEQLLSCPQCKHQTKTMIWSSINTEMDPKMRDELFKAEVNQFKCEKCDYKAFINTELLYHDIKRKFAVYYYPTEALKQESFLKQFKKEFPIKRNFPEMESMPHLLEGSSHLVQAHVTFSMNNLLYTILFYERLLDQTDEEKEKKE